MIMYEKSNVGIEHNVSLIFCSLHFCFSIVCDKLLFDNCFLLHIALANLSCIKKITLPK